MANDKAPVNITKDDPAPPVDAEGEPLKPNAEKLSLKAAKEKSEKEAKEKEHEDLKIYS